VREILESLRNRGSDTALVSDRDNISYEELVDQASVIASGLESGGLQTNDRFLVSLPNGSEYVLCYLAALIGGFTIVPIHHSTPANEIEHIWAVTNPKIHISNTDDLSSIVEGAGINRVSNKTSGSAIFFTSGTTGRSQGVHHSFSSLIQNAERFNEHVGIDSGIRLIHVLPMGYMAGFLNTVLSPLVAGGLVVVGSMFDASTAMSFWDTAERHKANAFWLTPTMAAFLARLNRGDVVRQWSSKEIKHGFIGTAPLPLAVWEKFRTAFGVECLESYGMTELMLVSSNSDRHPRKEGSVGKLIDGVQVEVRDSDGRSMPQTSTGSIFVKSAFALDGYLAWESPIPRLPLVDGWMSTGDIGHMDVDGHLYITGRLKDLIIHGGTNVSPRAVEEILASHPDVAEACVIGIPHEFWGEEVVAFLVPENGVSLGSDSIVAWCEPRMLSDAIPTRYEICDHLPKNTIGKVKRNMLRVRL
jgi:acyl-CoA synthetase (AMP-forming)/AMP-acid ligase II